MSKIFVARDLTSLVTSWKKSSDYYFIVILNKHQQQGIKIFTTRPFLGVLQAFATTCNRAFLGNRILYDTRHKGFVCSRLEPGTGGSGDFLVPGTAESSANKQD